LEQTKLKGIKMKEKYTPIPIIRLEVEGMRHAINVALHEHHLDMDSSIQSAVDEFCSKENIDAIVKSQVKIVIEKIINEEFHSFFLNHSSPCREAVRRAIKDSMNFKDRGEVGNDSCV
jgi:hypothetical protein